MKSDTVDLTKVIDALEGLSRELSRRGQRVGALEAAATSPVPTAAMVKTEAETKAPGLAPSPPPARPAVAEGLGVELILVIGAAIRQEGPHPPDSPDRSCRVGPAGPRHDSDIACAFGSFGEEPTLKLMITVDGKLYEVDVEIFEPEQPHPGYYSRPGQTRVLAAAPIAPRLAPRVAALWWPTRARSVAAPSPAPPGSRPRPGRPSRLMMSFWSSRP